MLAQLGSPDMGTPIAHALAYPERISTETPRLDWTKLGTLRFAPPDLARFPALTLSRQALKTGGTAPCILNAANEVAVAAFLKGKIGFLEICDKIEKTLNKLQPAHADSLEDILAADKEARNATM